MNIIKKIIEVIKKKLKKEENIKLLDKAKCIKNDENEFLASLKVNKTSNNKVEKVVETMICDGDGLGIQTDFYS